MYPQDLKGHRGSSQEKRIGFMTTDEKKKLLTQKQNTREAKDRTYALKNQSNIAKAAKQAEEEHSSKGQSYTRDVEECRKRIREASEKYGPKSDEAFKAMQEAIEYLSKAYYTQSRK